jgi:hypothetical protein
LTAAQRSRSQPNSRVNLKRYYVANKSTGFVTGWAFQGALARISC